MGRIGVSVRVSRYLWTNTSLDWFVGEEVEVRLVPTVNICDRTWAVREAILAATPNRDDTCEAVSALEMWAITELDFTGIYVPT